MEAHMAMPNEVGGSGNLEETSGFREPIGLIGPRFLTGASGTKVRGRWALAAGTLDDGVRVEWIAEGRILAQQETVATIEFDLEGTLPGDFLKRSVRAVLRGPDWSLELPALGVTIRAEG